jgi:hypothetical protein
VEQLSNDIAKAQNRKTKWKNRLILMITHQLFDITKSPNDMMTAFWEG